MESVIFGQPLVISLLMYGIAVALLLFGALMTLLILAN